MDQIKIELNEAGDNVWFTADQHFGHENIIRFCDRPFADAPEMDRAMIDRWNERVGENDTVFHLGDFTLNDGFFAEQIFNALNGNIYFLATEWHHDRRWLASYRERAFVDFRNGYSPLPITILPPVIVWTVNDDRLKRNGFPLKITMSHYPFSEWEASYHGAWHLHGHSHGKLRHKDYRVDVGVDSCGYGPINFGAILETMYEHGWV